MNGTIFNSKAIIDPVEYDQLEQNIKDELYDGKINSYNILPIYIGDYIASSDYLPSCCLNIGEWFYALDCTGTSNIGKVRRFRRNPNEEDISFAKDIYLGHANSVAYNFENNKIYVSPVNDYSTSPPSSASYLYVYDNNFNYLEKMNTPVRSIGVSFDPVYKKLYMRTYDFDIYVLENEEWVKYTTIDSSNLWLDNTYNNHYNQDLAVYDGKFYISADIGTIGYGYLTKGTSKVLSTFSVAQTDSVNRFNLGELEGMEFNRYGRLFASEFIRISQDSVNGFIVELGVGTSTTGISNVGGNWARHYTYDIELSSSVQSRFALRTTELRSINQVNAISKRDSILTIVVPENDEVTDPYTISIYQDICLYIKGTYVAKTFEIYSGMLSVYPLNTNSKLLLTSSSYCFLVGRVGSLKFPGSVRLPVETPNLSSKASNFINIGFSYPEIIIRATPISLTGIDFYIGSVVLGGEGLYIGQTNLWYWNKNNSLVLPKQTIIAGMVGDATTTLFFSIYTYKYIHSGLSINISSGKMYISGTLGYLNSGSAIDLTNSNYTLTYTYSGNVLNIKLVSSVSFTNCSPGTPIIADTSTDICINFS